MVDLSTAYLGLKLKSPLVVSSSPLTESPETIQRLEEAGAAAVVLPSIFEEQLTLESDALDRDLNRGTESFAESLSYFPEYEDYRQGQDAYLSQIQRAKSACSIPVLASLNGATARGWVRFAKEIEQAGADGLRRKQDLRLAQLYAIAVRRDFHRRDARMVVDVEDFFAVAAPGGSEPVANEKPTPRRWKGHDVHLGVPGFIGGVGNPPCVRRKHGRQTSAESRCRSGCCPRFRRRCIFRQRTNCWGTYSTRRDRAIPPDALR